MLLRASVGSEPEPSLLFRVLVHTRSSATWREEPVEVFTPPRACMFARTAPPQIGFTVARLFRAAAAACRVALSSLTESRRPSQHRQGVNKTPGAHGGQDASTNQEKFIYLFTFSSSLHPCQSLCIISQQIFHLLWLYFSLSVSVASCPRLPFCTLLHGGRRKLCFLIYQALKKNVSVSCSTLSSD